MCVCFFLEYLYQFHEISGVKGVLHVWTVKSESKRGDLVSVGMLGFGVSLTTQNEGERVPINQVGKEGKRGWW